MKKRILFVATIYRCGEKVYPILPHLSKEFEVDVLLYNQMSPKMVWPGNLDLRIKFYKMAKTNCHRVIYGPHRSYIKSSFSDPKFAQRLRKMVDFKKYDLVIIDDNMSKEAWGTPLLYRTAKEYGKTVIGCPHGNREFNKYINGYIGKSWDASFVFGPKEEKVFRKGALKKSVFGGGIPANDELGTMSKRDQYILVIPNHTYQGKNITGFDVFDYNAFVTYGILDLQQQYSCKVLVKLKSRIVRDGTGLQKSLRKHKNVHFEMDALDDNKMIADAKMVVASPSTLCFKSIQMGIPTAIIQGQGMLGNFHDFPGLVPAGDQKRLFRTIKTQMQNGKCEDFISDTLSGGLEFNATKIYVDRIHKIIKGN